MTVDKNYTGLRLLFFRHFPFSETRYISSQLHDVSRRIYSINIGAVSGYKWHVSIIRVSSTLDLMFRYITSRGVACSEPNTPRYEVMMLMSLTEIVVRAICMHLLSLFTIALAANWLLIFVFNRVGSDYYLLILSW